MNRSEVVIQRSRKPQLALQNNGCILALKATKDTACDSYRK